jgi:ABC-type dipeptide/oligopeptide/nickel transport system ATPase subunit
MANEESALKIEKLHGANYATWAREAEAVLTIKGLWSVVDEEPDNANAATRTNMAKAKAIILLNVDKSLHPIVTAAATPNEAWTMLQRMHQQASSAARLQLLEELSTIEQARQRKRSELRGTRPQDQGGIGGSR